MFKKIGIIVFLIILLVVGFIFMGKKSKTNTGKTPSYTAVLSTSVGDIKIKLNDDQTPLTVKNFVTLAKKKFYDKTIFHRVISGFMIQGGDPNGDGTGGPGYKFDDESFTGEYTRGTVAMANSGPNTNGSQFFIMHEDYPLPKNYVIFGHVTEGLQLCERPLAPGRQLRVGFLGQSPRGADEMGQAGLAVLPPALVDAVASADQDALPILNQGGQGFL